MPDVPPPFKQFLKGAWTTFFCGSRRVEDFDYLGIMFGRPVTTARGESWLGGHTKTAREGQKFDADGRGSDVVYCASTKSGLNPGRTLKAILRLRGVNPDAASEYPYDAGWPVDIPEDEPLYRGVMRGPHRRSRPRPGGPMSSTGGPKGHAMLPRVRAVLLRLQFEGHPDLAEVDVRKMGNYWLKVTGDSLMLDGGIPAHMVNGQGRWRLHASDPPEMVYKYRQSDLETKLKTSDL